MAGAIFRAFIIALLVAMPSLLLPGVVSDATAMVVLLALLAAMMTFVEYNSEFPSVVEFRYAPPFNRLRVGTLFLVVFMLTMISRGGVYPTDLSLVLTALGRLVGTAVDFPYSPVRLMVLMMPSNTSPVLIDSVRTAAGVSYCISVSAVLLFLGLVKFFGWPARNGAFNVWVNLPMFDPTAGDVLSRLTRDARVNIILGFLLPFMIPALVKAGSAWIDPTVMANPQTLIWAMTIWAFLPASMIMRGIALARIAEMIGEKRRRAYAEAEAQGLQAI
ncbi:hypothetical protein SAMN04488092_104267 [Thalassovita taeanensis]|uniref:Uncharacterized protein n=2 Tax=Thalassovita taeanensis TaxID=657014 RepID=A0A1H9DSM9_9RHOB|nr:hypothetical protein SAMN04488092_104267 [Thalassovita taeanensis]